MERFGIVYIAATGNEPPVAPPFTAYWDRGEPPEMLEEGPGWEDVEEAIAWGRQRAPRVLVRLGRDSSTMYSAGEVRLRHLSDGTGPEFPEWPPSGVTSEH